MAMVLGRSKGQSFTVGEVCFAVLLVHPDKVLLDMHKPGEPRGRKAWLHFTGVEKELAGVRISSLGMQKQSNRVAMRIDVPPDVPIRWPERNAADARRSPGQT